ncbi:DNA repair protein [Methanocella sp. CWC-04]|uniref:DNA repair protein n=2 Tax=Methanooceanicella nereidis TaxID=2052831 RepID=A0AAP2W6C8_9EURY|nr:DNA repair protein [Methanocella sp. CWC-04]
MRIKSVSLKNIKSYKNAEIRFSEGIIGISGLNGSGKSTILESIGYALFDYLPYTQSDFVRKGEKTGDIAVNITGADGMDYTVVRKCGSTQSYYIVDSFGMKVDGKDEVGDKLCEILGYKVLDINQLRSLFDNAVGVLQGTFVSEFLESASKRKAIFDPLLRIDEYNLAHKNLLPVKNSVKERIESMEKEISFLEGKVSILDKLTEEKATIIDGLKINETGLESKKLELADIKDKKNRMDTIEKEIGELESGSKVIDTEIKNSKMLLSRSLSQMEVCEAAERKVIENKDKYDLYKAKLEEKETLDKRKNEKYELLLKQKSLDARAEELQRRLSEHDNNLKEIERSEKDMEDIRPAVKEQEKLEEEKNQLMSMIAAKKIEASRTRERMSSLKNNKGNICPILIDVECKSVSDFSSYFNKMIEQTDSEKSALEDKVLDIITRIKELGDPRLKLGIMQDSVKKRDRILQEREKCSADIASVRSQIEEIRTTLSGYEEVDALLKRINDELRDLKPAYEEYQQNIKQAGAKKEWQKAVTSAQAMVEKYEKDLAVINVTLESKKGSYDRDVHNGLKTAYDTLTASIASISSMIESMNKRLEAINAEITRIEGYLKKIDDMKDKCSVEVEYLRFIDIVRSVIKEAGPEIIKVYIELISKEATRMYCEIAGDHSVEIRWKDDYEIALIEDGREKVFKQLSGGEQMSAALAVRLAILKILTNSDVVFLDEPTQNMDENRRQNLAQEIMRIKDFPQMFIISHDDTFNSNLEKVIEIEKIDGESRVRGNA